MIQNLKEDVNVNFASGDIGEICIGGRNNVVYLSNLPPALKVGDSISKASEVVGPRVSLHFYNVKSIDLLIKALELSKKYLNDINQRALAC